MVTLFPKGEMSNELVFPSLLSFSEKLRSRSEELLSNEIFFNEIFDESAFFLI